METQVVDSEVTTVNEAEEPASWNRPRTSEELQAFIESRQKRVGIFNLDLDEIAL